MRSPHYPAFTEEAGVSQPAAAGAAAAAGAEIEEDDGPIDPEKIKVEAKQVGTGRV